MDGVNVIAVTLVRGGCCTTISSSSLSSIGVGDLSFSIGCFVDDLDFALLFAAEFRLGDLPSEAAGDDTKCRE